MRRVVGVVLTLLGCTAPLWAHEPEEGEHAGITAPVLTDRVEPAYPDEALKAGLGGSVGLELSVSPEGVVTEVTVRRSAGHAFDEAAMEAARRFRFRPAMRAGHPIASTVLFDQQFSVRPHLHAETIADHDGSSG